MLILGVAFAWLLAQFCLRQTFLWPYFLYFPPFFVAIYLLFIVRLPPSLKTCEEVYNSLSTSPLYKPYVSKWEAFPELPYDCEYDPKNQLLFVSFKSLKGHGKIVMFDGVTGKALDAMQFIPKRNSRKIVPQDLAIDIPTQRIFLVILESPANFIEVISYSSAGLRWLSRIPFDDEPTDIEADSESRTLVVSLWPQKGKVIKIFDLDTLAIKTAIDIDSEIVFNLFEALSIGPQGNIFFAGPKNRLYRLDQHSGKRIDFKQLWPFIVDIGWDEEHLYLLDLNGAVIRCDLHSLQIEKQLRMDSGVRSLSVDTEAQRLFIGNYSRGTISIIKLPELKIIDSYQVGKLVRCLSLDRVNRRLFVGSGSGVLEIPY
jgi:hypothetical protein